MGTGKPTSLTPVAVHTGHEVPGPGADLITIAGVIHQGARRDSGGRHAAAGTAFRDIIVRVILQPRGVLLSDQLTVCCAEGSMSVLLARKQLFQSRQTSAAQSGVQP